MLQQSRACFFLEKIATAAAITQMQRAPGNDNFKFKSHFLLIFKYVYEHIPCSKLAYRARYDSKINLQRIFWGLGFRRILFPMYLPYRPS